MNDIDAKDWDDAYSNFAHIPDGHAISGKVAKSGRAIPA